MHPDEPWIGFVHVRFVEVVDEPARVPLADGVGLRLDGPLARERRFARPAVRQLEGGDVLAVIRVGQTAPGFEHGHAEAGFGQALGGPSA